MLCLHPHGWAGITPLALLGKEPRRKKGKMEHVFILAADIAFKLPGLRELFLFINARAANESVIEDVFCGGGSVAVFPGGIHEQLQTDPKQEKLFFPPNLGFVRQAIKHSMPLVPVYNFGENQQFGRWSVPFMPRFHPLQSRFGQAVDVGAADPEPTDARVREVFLRYCAELRRLFNEFKDTALPPAVAARGLKIVWRGHETEDLSADISGGCSGHVADLDGSSDAVGRDNEPANGCCFPQEGRESLPSAQVRCVQPARDVQLVSRM